MAIIPCGQRSPSLKNQIPVIHSNSEFDLARELEKRLAPRRAIEAAMSSGELKHVHKDTLVMRERIARPILRGILKMSGIYSRGIRNALQPVVRNVRLEFEDLPASFDGFRILQLADLHIDGMDGLAEIVAERIAGLHADHLRNDRRLPLRTGGAVPGSLSAAAQNFVQRAC